MPPEPHAKRKVWEPSSGCGQCPLTPQLLVENLPPIDPQSSVPEAVKLLREQSMVLSVTQINVEITTLLAQFGLYNPQPLSIYDLMLGIDEEEDGGKCNIVFP